MSAILCAEAWIDARLRAHASLAGTRIGKAGEAEAGRDEIVVAYAHMSNGIVRFNGGVRYTDSLLFQVAAEGRGRNLTKVAGAAKAIGEALDPTGRGVPPEPETPYGLITFCQLDREIDLPGSVDGVQYQRYGGLYRLHVVVNP
ncbi:MAG: hypothetical protein ACO1SV_21525 [Fimbriimonas sp.]